MDDIRHDKGIRPSDEAYAINEAKKELKALNGVDLTRQPVNTERVQAALEILNKYKAGKAHLDQRIVEDEEWYKLRNWECMRDRPAEVEPVSAWLFNAIVNKHADAMDNIPEPSILPREEADKIEAETLSSVVPVILDQCEFEQTYSDVSLCKIKTGTGVYGVFWDQSAARGLGNVAIKKINLLNLFWEPGITDIQQSRNVFLCELVDNEVLKESYPELKDNIGGKTVTVTEYIHDDTIDTTNKSIVVDWYYKRKNSAGKQILHYCKFVNDIVLFATENDPEMKERGWYDHGQYPFVFDVLFPVESTPIGIGYIDIGKNSQAYIDRCDQAVMENLLESASPRYFVREDAGINDDEFADTKHKLVHYTGNDPGTTPISPAGLPSIYYSILQGKIDELKETTGNRDISTGGSASGVTAASAIAAMQEAGSKLSRDSNAGSYRSFRKIVVMMIELIRQFYDIPRYFRILGENGTMRFVQYSNANILPQSQGNDFGIDMGYRVPLFDVDVTAAKASPYSKLSQNELALQFYSVGFFNPAMASQALMALDMMDFDRKSFVMQKIAENAMLFGQQMSAPAPNGGSAEETEALGGEEAEPSVTKNARERVAESTNPK